MKYDSGYYSSLGGTGIASIKYPSSMDINPASLSNNSVINFSITQSIDYTSYELLRIRDDIGALENKWNNIIYNLDQFSLVIPCKEFSLGVGIYRKLNPKIENKKIAVTYSDLIVQETNGNVYSLTTGFGYKISNSFLFGASFNYYFGKINSTIHGDNHKMDIDKWASIENDLYGINFKSGLIYSYENWSAGMTLETPFVMKVKTSKQISVNQLYSYLLPNYDETNWNQPFVAAVGISYCNYNNLLVEADYEIRKYRPSNVQINLYEFGGNPVWNNVSIFKLGMEYKPSDWNIPLKIGYTFIPQLYYSNNSVGYGNTILSYSNNNQNVKHLYTLGTTFHVNKLLLDFTISYSVLKWNRNLVVPQTVLDDYNEKITAFSIRIAYLLNK